MDGSQRLGSTTYVKIPVRWFDLGAGTRGSSKDQSNPFSFLGFTLVRKSWKWNTMDNVVFNGLCVTVPNLGQKFGAKDSFGSSRFFVLNRWTRKVDPSSLCASSRNVSRILVYGKQDRVSTRVGRDSCNEETCPLAGSRSSVERKNSWGKNRFVYR